MKSPWAAAFVALALLGGCGDDTSEPTATIAGAPAGAPLNYEYLAKLPLDVSDVVVDDTWTPPAGAGVAVEDEANPRPVEALARMVHDRISASGGPGRAMVTIEDASLTRLPGQLIGTFSVQLALEGISGDVPPPVVATVSGTRTLSSDSAETTTADALVRQLMERMNVELEYQMRHQLAAHMGGTATPVPSAVQTEDLAPPGSHSTTRPMPIAPTPTPTPSAKPDTQTAPTVDPGMIAPP